MLQTEQILQNRYQLQQQLGNNAGRQTWLVWDINTTTGELAIVKLLAFSPELQWDEFKLFEREANVLKQLNHPRIPRYRDYFSLDKEAGEGLCWFGLVQEYIPGKSLQQALDSGQRFSEEQVRAIATQILEILIYLHEGESPVIHRDIKPSNIILGEDDQIYLVDFGAVQDTAAAAGATFTIVGTTGYAPLEQFWGKAVPASDLYGLGATLIHLLTGICPADLPQDNLRIQFRDKVSINLNLVRWIGVLTEPNVDRRVSSAIQALEYLQTGRVFTYPNVTVPLAVIQPIKAQESGQQFPPIQLAETQEEATSVIGCCSQCILAISVGLVLLFSFSILISVPSGLASGNISIDPFSAYVLFFITYVLLIVIWIIIFREWVKLFTQHFRPQPIKAQESGKK